MILLRRAAVALVGILVLTNISWRGRHVPPIAARAMEILRGPILFQAALGSGRSCWSSLDARTRGQAYFLRHRSWLANST